METSTEISAGSILLKIAGRFDKDTHHVFHSTYRKLLTGCTQKEFVVAMDEVRHMDSSGLGALLLLHHDAAKQGVNVSIVRCPPVVSNILRTAKVDRLFAMTA